MTERSDFVPEPGAVLRLTRVFAAPRALVFAAWTEPERLARWWGPHGFTNPRCAFEARPGGKLRIDMRGPDGIVYPMDGAVQEFVPPARLVFTSRAFGPDDRTLIEALNSVTFAEEGAGTRVTLEARILALAPEFAAGAAGMKEGWSQSLERLADLVTDSKGKEG